ncbi:MAG: tRNA pseudouridine(55) synthase TruB [Lachnospiraceae bacterium]|nr:tRNA pseudouridine(55) synthase TruB [Lachnospiraceae bacterium]
MYNGVLNIYKEKGYTSHDVVAKLRGILKQKKIGHTGTLDPEAEGVLPVCLGAGTKLCDMLTDKDKEYVAQVRLGIMTDTQDMTGEILKESPVSVSEENVRDAVLSFVGEQLQIPPMYSALKVGGQRLYELARKGQEVERKARPITIREIEITAIDLPEFTMRVVCSKGTYIRTLCHDIGEKLGCHGCMKSLLRTRVSSFSLSEAFRLSDIEQLRDEERLAEVIIPIDRIFSEYPKCVIKREFVRLIENGNKFYVNHIEAFDRDGCRLVGSMFAESEQIRVYDADGRFYGIYRFDQRQDGFVPVKMFLER